MQWRYMIYDLADVLFLNQKCSLAVLSRDRQGRLRGGKEGIEMTQCSAVQWTLMRILLSLDNREERCRVVSCRVVLCRAADCNDGVGFICDDGDARMTLLKFEILLGKF
ncbi:hypothetical protein HELRODRAFT_159086 [Helobdella robusta]|uniref:Uncharacterized protein n=1 Tax=Helobdella robusta TaxID=6412 RepID=T1ENK6_HELRO|nr:hypothetical protein HELRODRAFT_159086 [Helobdella robusta]ESO12530.1 hypothetical protein HELRODRAFT_159086 [Helobdella robusta]